MNMEYFFLRSIYLIPRPETQYLNGKLINSMNEKCWRSCSAASPSGSSIMTWHEHDRYGLADRRTGLAGVLVTIPTSCQFSICKCMIKLKTATSASIRLRKANTPLTWYMEQLKQCQQQLSPSTYFFAWPFSHGRLHTDSGGFRSDLNCTSTALCCEWFID